MEPGALRVRGLLNYWPAPEFARLTPTKHRLRRSENGIS
jgi:hypothetical protein